MTIEQGLKPYGPFFVLAMVVEHVKDHGVGKKLGENEDAENEVAG